MKFGSFFKELSKESKTFAKGIGKNAADVASTIGSQIEKEFSTLSRFMSDSKNYNVVAKNAERDVVKFGKLEMADFNKALKSGKVEDAFKLSINKKLTETEVKVLKVDVTPRPTAKISKIEDSIEKVSTTKNGKRIKQIETAEEFDKMAAKDSAITKWVKENPGKTVGFLAKTTLVIAGVTTLGVLVEKHMKKMSYCCRYEYNESTGNTKTCIVGKFTCHEIINRDVSICDPALIRSDVGDEVFNGATCGNNTGCIVCDSYNNNPHIDDINVVYRCKKASFLDAFVDMLGDGVNRVLDSAGGAAERVLLNLSKNLWKPVALVLLVLLVCVIVYKKIIQVVLNDSPKQAGYAIIDNGGGASRRAPDPGTGLI